jgi:hypothetical protein
MACLPALAFSETFRARITGSRGDRGKCTIEVVVDEAAEVEVIGDTGRIRTLAGSPSHWVRMECTSPLPRKPEEFRFRGIDGRGRVELVRDPRSGRGAAVVRIFDPKGGREGYTFDLEWRGYDNSSSYNEVPRRVDGQRQGNKGRVSAARAVEICREAAADRLRRNGFDNIHIRNIEADNWTGRGDLVQGIATAHRSHRTEEFNFSCSVDLSSGQVRNVRLDRR